MRVENRMPYDEDYNILKITGGNGIAADVEQDNMEDVLIDNITVVQVGNEGKTEVDLSWEIPILDISAQWYPACGPDRAIKADWAGDISSRTSNSAPVFCFYNDKGLNRLTFAVSEATKPVTMSAGVHEEDGTLHCSIKITLDTEELPYRIKLYRNRGSRMYYEVLGLVAAWWEKDCKMPSLRVPGHALKPMYSTWYSFHQDMDAAVLEKECRLARSCGFETLIVDDGWQTDDNNRGYAFCGDWEVEPKKIPDMKEHVRRIHEAGMKYMLWFSVPFVGIHSKAWERMSDKIIFLEEKQNAGVLDVRYPQVREYLTSVYTNAVREWDIDGLKLDFIDEFYLRSSSVKFAAGMDVCGIEEALNTFLSQVIESLKSLKPDIMIEFRQRYIGPNMRRFSNIIRVSDCPESSLSNRVGSTDIRLLSGDTAVHSDMIMWHRDESPENAARQIMNSIFATLQLSVKLEEQNEEKLEMIRFWTAFTKEYGEILYHGRLMPYEPQNLYPVITAGKDDIEITALYSADRLVPVSSGNRRTIILNAVKQMEIIIKTEKAATYFMRQKNCRGHVVYEKTERMEAGLYCLPVTESGLLELERIGQ